MLHKFVTEYRDEIISRCRAKVATRSSPPPTTAEIDHGVPMFLDELVDELRLGLSPNQEITKTATQHGHDMLRQGFTVSQVVHDYGDVCQSITELALDLNAPISTDDFRMLNKCLDDAIAGAVTQYEQEQDLDEVAAGESEQLAVLARDLRKSIHNASVAFDVIQSGRIGLTGSTGTTLGRSLVGAQDLIDKLIDEIRTTQRITDGVTVKGPSPGSRVSAIGRRP